MLLRIVTIATTGVWTTMAVYELGSLGSREAWLLATVCVAFVAIAWVEARRLRRQHSSSAANSILALTAFAAMMFMFLAMHAAPGQ